MFKTISVHKFKIVTLLFIGLLTINIYQIIDKNTYESLFVYANDVDSASEKLKSDTNILDSVSIDYKIRTKNKQIDGTDELFNTLMVKKKDLILADYYLTINELQKRLRTN